MIHHCQKFSRDINKTQQETKCFLFIGLTCPLQKPVYEHCTPALQLPGINSRILNLIRNFKLCGVQVSPCINFHTGAGFDPR